MHHCKLKLHKLFVYKRSAVKNAISGTFQILLSQSELPQYLGDKLESFHNSSENEVSNSVPVFLRIIHQRVITGC